MLILDKRETKLREAFGEYPIRSVVLPVGDVVCEYSDGGDAWVAERKTARDLATSLRSGHLTEQSARLHEAGFSKIIWIIEGDLHKEAVSHKSLLAACVGMCLRKTSYMIRVVDIHETVEVLKQLVIKCKSEHKIPSGAAPPAPLTKRKKDATPQLVFMRQLMCIPTVSEQVARKLVEYFGDINSLQAALSHEQSFPRIGLSNNTCIGAARITTMRKFLVPEGNMMPSTHDQRGKRKLRRLGARDEGELTCNHVPTRRPAVGPRDNGEFDWYCEACGILLTDV